MLRGSADPVLASVRSMKLAACCCTKWCLPSGGYLQAAADANIGAPTAYSYTTLATPSLAASRQRASAASLG